MKLRRLLNMTISEVAYRGRKEISKRFDRLGVTGGMDRVSDALVGKPAGMLLEDFGRVAPARFFEGVVDDVTPHRIAQHMRESYDETVTVADAVCRLRFDLPGHQGLTFGDPVDWHLDPIARRRSEP